MDNTTTVNEFQRLRNRVLGRLSQCTSPEQLKQQLQLECDKIPFSRADQMALIGKDITDGIDRANAVIDGALDDL
jgi:hypothetical protein